MTSIARTTVLPPSRRVSVAHFGTRRKQNMLTPCGAATSEILRLASQLEGNDAHLMEWFRDVPINELGDVTARELVLRNESCHVISFLRSILEGERE